MNIANYFTDYQKQRFFERTGFPVQMHTYTRHVKYTHGWWENEQYEAPSVKIGDTWRKVSTLFSEVMTEKLKNLLTGDAVDDNALIRAIVQKGRSDER